MSHYNADEFEADSLNYSALDQAELDPVIQASFLGGEEPLPNLIFEIIA